LLPRGIPPKQLKVEKRVKLRCKDGDIAMITWDLPECLENIGRLVQVRGPVAINGGVPHWAISPVTPELYAFREIDDSLAYENVTWASRIEHPDEWMTPIQPEQESPVSEESSLTSQPVSNPVSVDCVCQPVEAYR
jgi:hypothetical protein